MPARYESEFKEVADHVMPAIKIEKHDAYETNFYPTENIYVAMAVGLYFDNGRAVSARGKTAGEATTSAERLANEFIQVENLKRGIVEIGSWVV